MLVRIVFILECSPAMFGKSKICRGDMLNDMDAIGDAETAAGDSVSAF